MTTTDIILNFLGGVLIAIGILTFIYAFWKSSVPAFGGLSIRKMLKFKRTFRRLFEGICIGAVQDENGVKHIFETSFNTSTNQYNDFLKLKNKNGGNNIGAIIAAVVITAILTAIICLILT